MHPESFDHGANHRLRHGVQLASSVILQNLFGRISVSLKRPKMLQFAVGIHRHDGPDVLALCEIHQLICLPELLVDGY